MLHKIHQTKEEKNASRVVEAIREESPRVLLTAIRLTNERGWERALGTLTNIISSLKSGISVKVDNRELAKNFGELKGAVIATNKEIGKVNKTLAKDRTISVSLPASPRQAGAPQTDLKETNRLLQKILDKKDDDIDITLSLV